LVSQVKLPKRLDPNRDAERALDRVPALIVSRWVEARLCSMPYGLFFGWAMCLVRLMTKHMIDTERLLLRGWKPEDHAPFAKICGDPDVMRYIGDGSTRTADEVARSIASFQKEWNDRGFGLFAVELKQTGNMIGFTGFSLPHFLPEVLPSVEIGWRFSKQSWGKGFASEAAAAALAFGVNYLRITDIVSIYQVENGASARIMKKLGMIFDRRTIDPTCQREVEVYRLPKR
jgi:RimJ/RimL family protein N-acetyltransferase